MSRFSIPCVSIVAAGLALSCRLDGYETLPQTRAGSSNGTMVEDSAARELSVSPFGLHVLTPDLDGPVEIGARWTRILALWKRLQPRKGVFRIPDRVVHRLNELTTAGFEVLPRIVSVNPWANTDRTNQMNRQAAIEKAPMGDWTYISTPSDMEEYRRFLTRLVETFDGDGSDDAPGLRKGIRYWQIENEWDWRWKGSPEDFVTLLKTAYETIKTADPKAIVVLGGISKLAPDAFHAGLLGESFELDGRTITPEMLENQKHFKEQYPLRKYVLENGHPYFDVISFHQYGRYQAIDAEVEYLRNIMREQDYDKPIWMTEAGGPFAALGEEYTEDRHAQEVIKYYVTALASGVEVVFWSTYLPTPEWGKAFANTALIDNRKQKKPAYHSYQLMTTKLRDCVRVERLFGSDHGQLVRFIRRDGDPVYVAWLDDTEDRETALENIRSRLSEKVQGKKFTTTRYDGEVLTVNDLLERLDDVVRRGPVFAETE